MSAVFAHPLDDPRAYAFEKAVEAIDSDPKALHNCACTVIRTGAFDDLLMGQIRPDAMAGESVRFVLAVRAEVERRATQAIGD